MEIVNEPLFKKTQTRIAIAVAPNICKDSHNLKYKAMMNSDDMRKFVDISCEERVEPLSIEEKQCIIASIIEQIADLEKQVKESQEWHNCMATSFEDKLIISMHERKKLRSEKAKMKKLIKEKSVFNNATTKRMTGVENTLTSTDVELEQANGYLKRLETKNAGMKAEIKACKLSVSQTSTTSFHIMKREKKMSKKTQTYITNVASPNISKDSQNLKNKVTMNLDDLRKFVDMSCEERVKIMSFEEKQCIIASITEQIEDLEEQVKESQDWFNCIAASSMDKLTISMHEKSRLRSEKAKMKKLIKGKLVLNNATTKRMTHVENTLRSTNVELKQARGYLTRLETDNAEIKAEIEACKLSASELNITRLQVAKRENKMSKRTLALQKQMAKLELEVAKEKEKTSELEKVLARTIQYHEKVEAKLKEEIKAKSEARALIMKEQLLMEVIEADINKKIEEVVLKMEIDFLRHKDDVCRIEQEISNVTAATRATK